MIGSISLGIDFALGKKRVPKPAAGITALRTGVGFITGCVYFTACKGGGVSPS